MIFKPFKYHKIYRFSISFEHFKNLVLYLYLTYYAVKLNLFNCFKDIFEVQEASLKPGSRVVIVDDLIATGGILITSINY